jgi:hypothetical protein
MNTRTLRNISIALIVVLAGAIGYLQWDRGPAPANGADEHAAVVTPSAAGAFDAVGSDEKAAKADAAKGASPVLQQSGLGMVNLQAKETRPLTTAEKDKVAAAMADFQKAIHRISPRKQVFMVTDSSATLNTNTNAMVVRSFAPKSDLVLSDAMKLGTTAKIGTDEFLFALGSPEKSEADQIAAASKELSELLKQFEPGSPAWKEARREGEELMKQLNSGNAAFSKTGTGTLTLSFGDGVQLVGTTEVKTGTVTGTIPIPKAPVTPVPPNGNGRAGQR